MEIIVREDHTNNIVSLLRARRLGNLVAYFAILIVDDHEGILYLLGSLSKLVNHFDRLVMHHHAVIQAMLYVVQFDVVGIVQRRITDVLLHVKLSGESELGGVLCWLDYPGFCIGIVIVDHRFLSGEVHWTRHHFR